MFGEIAQQKKWDECRDEDERKAEEGVRRQNEAIRRDLAERATKRGLEVAIPLGEVDLSAPIPSRPVAKKKRMTVASMGEFFRFMSERRES